MLVKNFLDVIKSAFLIAPQTYGKIFSLFAELELNIKNSLDPRTHFENTCLYAIAI